MYEEKVSIPLAENEKNPVLTLSEDGHFLAISGTMGRLWIWRKVNSVWKAIGKYRLNYSVDEMTFGLRGKILFSVTEEEENIIVNIWKLAEDKFKLIYKKELLFKDFDKN